MFKNAYLHRQGFVFGPPQFCVLCSNPDILPSFIALDQSAALVVNEIANTYTTMASGSVPKCKECGNRVGYRDPFKYKPIDPIAGNQSPLAASPHGPYGTLAASKTRAWSRPKVVTSWRNLGFVCTTPSVQKSCTTWNSWCPALNPQSLFLNGSSRINHFNSLLSAVKCVASVWDCLSLFRFHCITSISCWRFTVTCSIPT